MLTDYVAWTRGELRPPEVPGARVIEGRAMSGSREGRNYVPSPHGSRLAELMDQWRDQIAAALASPAWATARLVSSREVLERVLGLDGSVLAYGGLQYKAVTEILKALGWEVCQGRLPGAGRSQTLKRWRRPVVAAQVVIDGKRAAGSSSQEQVQRAIALARKHEAEDGARTPPGKQKKRKPPTLADGVGGNISQ